MEIRPTDIFASLGSNLDKQNPHPETILTEDSGKPVRRSIETVLSAEYRGKDASETPSAAARIDEIGFRAYAEEIKKEKLEQMRKEILGTMGLSEEDLKKMSPEQRDVIEKMIAEEIRRRLGAESKMDDEKKPHGLMPGLSTTLIAPSDGAPGGLGVLIALQERDVEPAPPKQKTDDKT